MFVIRPYCGLPWKIYDAQKCYNCQFWATSFLILDDIMVACLIWKVFSWKHFKKKVERGILIITSFLHIISKSVHYHQVVRKKIFQIQQKTGNFGHEKVKKNIFGYWSYYFLINILYYPLSLSNISQMLYKASNFITFINKKNLGCMRCTQGATTQNRWIVTTSG